jgi:hypothetical protein
VRRLSPWLEALAVGVATGALVPLLGQLVPPFHVPTHELATLFTLVSAAVAYGFGAWWAHRLRRVAEPLAVLRGAFARVGVALLVMGPVAWGTIVLADSLRCGCRLQLGAAYFHLTWPPLALLAGVVGSALGAAGWRRRNLLLLVAAALSVDLVHDAMQALVGFRVVDLLVGKPLAFDQRAGMEPIPIVHVYQRLFVLALAWVAWCWASWWAVAHSAAQARSLRAEARARLLPAVLGAAGLAVVALTLGSHIGLGWGDAALRATLSQELRTEHFVVRYPPGERAALEARVLAREAEWNFHRYQQDWGVEPERPLVIHLFDDRDQLEALTDTASTHVVFRRVYAPWWVTGGSTLHHELAHALHMELEPAPVVALSRGILEGLAEAYEDDYAVLPEAHIPLAGALEAGTLPSARELMHPLGFFRINEGNAYDASGSFVGWLVLEHGFERFVALQRSQTLDFEAVYGRDLGQLDDDWRAFLAALPVDLEEQLEARDRFDPELWPAYGDRCCPKLERVVPTPVELAEQLRGAESWADALAAYTGLWERQARPRQAYQASLCHWHMGQPERGLELVERALEAEGLAEVERYRLAKMRIDLLLVLERWDTLERALDERDSFDAEPTRYRRAFAALMRDPLMREGLSLAAREQSPDKRRVILEELLQRHPDDPDLRYVHAIWVFEHIGGRWGLGVGVDERQRGLEALRYAADAPGTVDALEGELLDLIDKAIRARDLDLAEQLVEGALPLAIKPTVRRRIERRRDRVAWERARGAG